MSDFGDRELVLVPYGLLRRARDLGEAGDCVGGFEAVLAAIGRAKRPDPPRAPLCPICELRAMDPEYSSWGCQRCVDLNVSSRRIARAHLVGTYPQIGWRIANSLGRLLPDLPPADLPLDPLKRLVALIATTDDADLLELRDFGVRSLAIVRAVIPHRP